MKRERETVSWEKDRDEEDNSTAGRNAWLDVCSYFRYRRSEDSEDKGTCEPRITVPAVSVDNYAGTFPGSRQNSHGIVNSQEGSGRG